MKYSCEYLIIGQGVAGSLLCQELLEAKKSICVIDNHHERSSSLVAAGIINPITGRRFVKSWMIDELLPFSEQRFTAIASKLKQPNYYRPKKILRCLFSQVEETEWLIRTAQEGWKQYVQEVDGLGEFTGHVTPGFGQGVLLGAQVDLARFVIDYRELLKSKELLIEKKFETEELFQSNSISTTTRKFTLFDGLVEYDKIIFCEGAAARHNKMWDFVPFEPAKGEVLHLKIPGLQTDRLLKHKMMMTPLGNELFWFGSNYEWNAKSEEPSEEGLQFLQKRLDKMLPKYEVIDHLAATRPTIKDRRPVLGEHPVINGAYIFNGLGTKGASLGPYFAKEMCELLTKEQPILSEVHLNRFWNNQPEIT